MDQPLVTCICPTMLSRREWLPKMIECFHAQTWPNKQLVIVDVDLSVDAYSIDDGIRVVRGGGPLGQKRNQGCAGGSGEYIAHFDDDDWSAPNRLEDQIGRLRATGKLVTGYHSILFSDGTRRWKYHGDSDWTFDASLCYSRDFWFHNPFYPINDGLEYGFRAAAQREKVFVSSDGAEFLTASIHAANTSPRVIGFGWEELQA